MKKTRYKMTVAYEGTDFYGWQGQPSRRTVQGCIESAIKQITNEQARPHGSGRTDAGVHARGQVAHIDLRNPIDAQKLLISLNGVLPDDVRVMKLSRAPMDFHARYHATQKTYCYFIWNQQIMDPMMRKSNTHIRRELDLERMIEATAILQGKHDFAAFCANTGFERKGTVRNLSEFSIKKKGPQIRITAVGDGFLYKMVRTLSGFLIRVGHHELPVADAKKILKSRKRTADVPTARPQGLFLWKVKY